MEEYKFTLPQRNMIVASLCEAIDRAKIALQKGSPLKIKIELLTNRIAVAEEALAILNEEK